MLNHWTNHQIVRESIPRQIEKKSRVPKVEKGVWESQSGDRGLEFSRRRKGQTFFVYIPSVQFSSAAQSCPTLCDPVNRSTPGLPVHHQLLEFTQTHVHRVGDAIPPSHPLLSPSPALNPSQHQGLFKWVTLCMKWPKYWSFSFSISPSNEHPGLISVLVNYPTQFKLCTRDYITTMYPAWGQFLLPENFMTNPDILECVIWE